jgi:photosystem II stability/assembly factor-like uncharacterized protein
MAICLQSSPVTQSLNDLDMVNEDEGWAVGEGTIIHYIAGEWREVTSPTKGVLTTIDMINEQEGWALGLDGKILHYQDGIWQQLSPIIEKNFEIEMISETEGWILGREGGESVILRYDGNAWQSMNHPQGYSLGSMDMLSSEEGWFISKEGILHYQAGEWKIFDNPGHARAMVMINENEGWAVGRGILHYTSVQ